ncbi:MULTISPECIES: hypothetical protein [unclassified Serratia (in: enterobacteria)]|uniref:hypothetical protein n=1 Tax=unclassified Serratia (in: enterobacteria) TaxID=2647522 RepID=UPI0005087C31|nr:MULTISPECIES: hypothetical protein [unclassified Serratia (in: enterobacteria)]KFK93329.1 bacteriophage protein [Serratia sp. Ag2]KFK98330.1 bacteriophage protein [Serratia sp. Ag1]
MSQNWMRHFELVLSDNDGKGIILSDFKITFDIQWNDNKWPSNANVRIYNLSPSTQNLILAREYSKMKIIAGYDGIAPNVPASDVGKVREISDQEVGQINGMNFGLIYSGDIRFTVSGKDNGTDSWVFIQACDGLEVFQKAFISATLAKGYTLKDVYHLLMRSLEPYGIVGGSVPDFPATVFPRGKSFYGPVHEYLDNLAEQCSARWQFAYGRVDMRTKDMIAHEAFVLNSHTGLIGMPQQTIGAGVNVKCLINPNIKLNGLIQLDQASVYRTALQNQDIYSGVFNEKEINGNLAPIGKVRDAEGNWVDAPPMAQPASVATDGVYIVRYITYKGDTRGKDWYMEMACEARGATDLPSSSFLQRQDS